MDETKPKQRSPLRIVLSRNQTKEQVQKSILEAHQILTERRDEISKLIIPIQGYEQTSLHPSMIKGAKAKYAEAIEWGLIGLMIVHGLGENAREVYGIAYCKAQIKGSGENKRLRMKGIDSKHMEKILMKSNRVFLELIREN